MKKITVIILSAFFLLPAFGMIPKEPEVSSEKKNVQLYLGIRGGAGVMLSRAQLDNLGTSTGFIDATTKNSAWSLHGKGEVLLGFKRLRIGYQFLYNFSQTRVNTSSTSIILDAGRRTTYFNNSQTNFFGHYLLVELAVVNRPHFALAPGIAVGSFTGFKVDKDTKDKVQFSQITHNPFSIGAELNFEIKFGRCVFLLSPNYYMFHVQDKQYAKWRQYQHFMGLDLGFRVNLLKP